MFPAARGAGWSLRRGKARTWWDWTSVLRCWQRAAGKPDIGGRLAVADAARLPVADESRGYLFMYALAWAYG